MSNIARWSIRWVFFSAAGAMAFAISVGAEERSNISSTRPAPAAATPREASSWPGPSNTGVPEGVSLTPYSGPCTIAIPQTIIDAKLVNCDLRIRAAGVVITRSKINGSIDSDTEKSTGYSFTLEDSEVNVSQNGPRLETGVGHVNFVVRRSHIYGGNRSADCWQTCLIEDSWLHGQDTDKTGVWHESAVRMGEDAVIRHNTLACDAPDVPPDAGCSASLTGYGDFGPVQNNIIEGNWFPGTTGGFCAYGGSSKGKPYSGEAKNVVFKNNVFGKGSTGKCGSWGPITDYDYTRPGNQWINNRWEDGRIIPTP